MPDNVAVDVRTSGGNVSLRGYRGTAKVTTSGGQIDIAGYCGNSLDARAGDGRHRARRRVRAAAAVAALEVGLDPRHAARRAATTSTPRALRRASSVRGITPRDDAPYSRAGAQRLRATSRGGTVVIATLELDGRFTRAGTPSPTSRVTLPVTLLALPAVAALMLGAALSVAGIGLPLLVAAADVLPRARARSTGAPPTAGSARRSPPTASAVASRRTAGGAFRRSLDLLSDRSLWRTATHLALRPAARRGAAASSRWCRCSCSRCCCSSGSAGSRAPATSTTSARGRSGPALGLVLCALALPAAALAIAALETLYRVLGVISSHALLVPRMPPGGPVREMLAESLGDRTRLGRLLAARPRALRGRVRPPGRAARAGSGRAWTAVDRDGRRVAAIIHDAALDTTPELVDGRGRGRPRWRSTTSA